MSKTSVGKKGTMDIEKMVFYLLRKGEWVSRKEIEEIIKSITNIKISVIAEIINKLIKKSDLTEKEGKIKLLAKAKRKMIKSDPQVHYGGIKWGRRWTMVIFDFPERDKKTRDVLRYQLQKRGFGMMQLSVWVKPFDVSKEIRNFIRGRNLQWRVKVLTFNMRHQDEKETIHRIWKMDKLNNEYKEFIEHTKKRFKAIKNYSFEKKRTLYRALDLLARITEKDYLQLYEKDPELNSNLLPTNWAGKRAFNIYRQLDKYLARE